MERMRDESETALRIGIGAVLSMMARRVDRATAAKLASRDVKEVMADSTGDGSKAMAT